MAFMIETLGNGSLDLLKQKRRREIFTVCDLISRRKSTSTNMLHPVAAAFQALRVASFMSRPTLLSIEALVMMGPYLTNCGKLLDASAVFGLTVRLAQSIGCEYLICH